MAGHVAHRDLTGDDVQVEAVGARARGLDEPQCGRRLGHGRTEATGHERVRITQQWNEGSIARIRRHAHRRDLGEHFRQPRPENSGTTTVRREPISTYDTRAATVREPPPPV